MEELAWIFSNGKSSSKIPANPFTKFDEEPFLFSIYNAAQEPLQPECNNSKIIPKDVCQASAANIPPSFPSKVLP